MKATVDRVAIQSKRTRSNGHRPAPKRKPEATGGKAPPLDRTASGEARATPPNNRRPSFFPWKISIPSESKSSSVTSELEKLRKGEPRKIQLRRTELEDKREALRKEIDRRRRRRGVYLIAGVGLVTSGLIGLAIFGFASPRPSVSIALYSGLAVVYGVGALFLVTSTSTQWAELDLSDTEQQIDLLSFYDADREQRAERLFKLHQNELKKYYDITRSQSSWIFYVGIGCILLGFAIVAFSLYLISAQVPGAQVGDKLVIGGLGAAGSLLSNFIAAIYLNMHSDTVRSLTEFHRRLVATHYLHYGFFLAAKLANSRLREDTIHSMALIASRGAITDQSTPAADRSSASLPGPNGTPTRTTRVKKS